MQKYSVVYSIWKGVIPLLISGGILTAGQATDLEEAAMILAPVILALWYGLLNWSKKSPNGFGDPLHMVNSFFRRLAVPLVFGVLVLGGAGGCAKNALTIAEVSPDGSSFQLDMQQSSTPWAKVEDGSNNLVYSGDGWHLAAGNASANVEGGDPSEVLGQLIGAALSAFIGNLNAPRDPASPDIWSQLLNSPILMQLLTRPSPGLATP